MTDFSNHDERRAWLEKQSREICVAMANRAAMRVFPMAVLPTKAKDAQRLDLTGATKWALLISAVAAYSATAEIKASASAASVASASASASALASASAASVTSVASAAAFSASAAASAVASTAASAVATAASAASDAAAIDQGTTAPELLALPLWPDENPLLEDWQKTRKILESDAVDQSFWINWYERFLHGQPQNWEMLQEIALTVKKDDWEKGSAHVNGMIADIQAKYLRKSTPLAEKVEINPLTNRLHIVPERMSQKTLYQNALEKVRDDMDYFRDGGFKNAHSALENVFTRILDRTFEKYRNSPQRVHDDFVLARNRILRLIEAGELADDDEVRDFMQVLETGALDIRGAIKAVDAAVGIRERKRWQELSDAQRVRIENANEEVAKASDPDMAEEIRTDVSDALDKELVDSDGNTDPIAIDAQHRTSSRLPRAYQALKKNGKKAAVGVGGGYSIGEIALGVTELFGLFGL